MHAFEKITVNLIENYVGMNVWCVFDDLLFLFPVRFNPLSLHSSAYLFVNWLWN